MRWRGGVPPAGKRGQGDGESSLAVYDVFAPHETVGGPRAARTSILPSSEAEPRGVGYELDNELARRLGVPYEPVVFSKNAEVLAAVRSSSVDVAFTNASASRAQEMDFGPAYLEIELGYLVPKASAIAALSEIDVPGGISA